MTTLESSVYAHDNTESTNISDAFLEAANALPQDSDEDGDYTGENTFYGREARRGDTFVSIAEWDESLCQRDVSFMISPFKEWGGDSKWKGNYHPGEFGWLQEKCTWLDFATTFTKPRIHENKNGSMFFPGELRASEGTKGIARSKANVKSLHFMTFDLDMGQPESEFLPKLIDSGLAFVHYPSHSNGKASSKIEFKKLRDFDPEMALTPSDADMRRYFESVGYHQSIVESVRVTKGAVPPDPFAKPGEKPAELCVVVSHAPITKCRIIFLLDKPVVFSDDWKEAAETERDWRALYHHVGTEFGFQFDASGADLNRGFYSARCKPTAHYRAVFGGSTAMALPECTPEMRRAVGDVDPQKRKVALEARRATRGGASKVEGVPDTGDFMWRHGDEFDVLKWIDDLGWETRSEVKRSANGWKQSIRCPNESQHSSMTGVDTGCVAIMPNSGYGSAAKIVCKHDHCSFFTEDFLEMICEEVLAADNELSELENYVFAESAGGPAAENDNNPGTEKLDFTALKKLLEGTPYALKNDWIEHRTKDEDGKPRSHHVCKAFQPLDMTCAENDEEWGVRIRFADFNGKLHTSRIPVGEIFKTKSDLRADLANKGLEISLDSAGFKGLFALLTRLKERAVVVRKPGWRPDFKSFVCPDGAVVGDSAVTVILAEALTDQRIGTYAGLQEAWDIALRHGFPHHYVGMLAGVSGCLVQYINLDSNPVIGLTGDSSAGKTTAMMLGASAFGCCDDKKDGLMHIMKGSDNSVENPAQRSTGTFLGLDETAHLDPAILEKTVFMLAAGRGKPRMNPNGTQREGKSWQTLPMLSSEVGLTALVERGGESARVGFTARVADIDCPKGFKIADDLYERMKGLLLANHGWIGPMFVEALLKSGATPADLRKEIHAKTIDLVGKDAPALVWRSAGVFALLWATGERLQALGVIKELAEGGERSDFAALGDAEAKIKAIWTAYRGSDEAVALVPHGKAVDTLREKLYSLRGSSVHDLNPEDYQKPGYGEAWAWFKKVGATTIFYVRTDKLFVLAGGAVKKNGLCKELEALGILERRSKEDRTFQRLPGGEQVQHYRLTFPETAEYDPFG